MLKIHTISGLYGCELATDKEFQEAYELLPISNPYYEIYLYYYGIETSKWYTYTEAVDTYGEDSVHATTQFNKIMFTILELDKHEDGDDKGMMKDYITFGEGDSAELILPFKNIRYTTTEETTEDTEG